MSHPFHKILVNNDGTSLFIATAQSLRSFELVNGTLSGNYEINSAVSRIVSDSVAKKNKKPQTSADQNRVNTKPIEERTVNGNPADVKPADEEPTERSKAEVVAKQPTTSKPTKASIQNLILSKNQKYLIGTTNEEKLGLVFNAANGEGILNLISQRTFSKRPSAIDTISDDSTLILGDKFGDVYEFPLLSNEPVNTEEDDNGDGPILGHVSMLVDLVVAENENQQYIITADRDEHIRVSRYPKSYIIVRWLFAHTEFVSSLRLIPWESTLLISGGGDNFICVWRWTSGLLIQKFDIVNLVKDYLTTTTIKNKKINDETTDNIEVNPKNEETNVEIATSDILAVPGLKQIVVLCEGANAIIQLDVHYENLIHASTTVLPHKAISITVDSSNRLYVSYDHPEDLIGIFQLKSSGPAEPILSELSQKIIQNSGIKLTEGYRVSLYNASQLRKRPEW